jgi:predicted nucleic acid-binding protein
VIAYFDASALVKRYLVERGSRETIELTSQAEMIATSIISRAEVAAGLAKAVRAGAVTDVVARNAQRSFARDWPDLLRLPVTEALVERAEALAWEHGLRGYDAVQLASGLTWQESAGQEIVLATFDQQLWEAAKRTGLKPWPDEFPGGTSEPERPRDKQDGTS